MTCPICDTTLVDHAIGSVGMLMCPECTAVVRPSHLAPLNSAAYYKEDYSLTTTVRRNKELHRYYRYPEYQRLIGTVLECVPEARSWLDIGCDHGFFLDDARRYVADVMGVEPSSRGREYAHSIGLDVRKELAEVNGTFDVVSMWHVLEHLEDPRLVLHGILDVMQSGSVLAIRVPDANSFWSRVLRHRWIWFQPQNHAVHYNRRSLEQLLRSCGFHIVFLRQQRPNTWLTRRAYRLARSVTRSAFGAARPTLRDYLARTYQDITGQELFVVARKP